MLRSLSIRNYAIIDTLDLDFAPGLNVLTGETGAGKSIIIDALNIILGGRVSADMVRGGAAKAVVDAVFDVSGSQHVIQTVAEMGLETEEGLLFLTREVSTGGKSTARVGGRPCSVAQLKEIGDWLVDLHGQHEHQSLLSVARHVDLLDEWGGQEVLALRQKAGEAFQRLRALERERAGLETDARERAHLIDLYRFQTDEIAQAGLAVGEDEELLADARRLANAQKLAESAGLAAAAVSGDGGAVERLAEAARSLEDAVALDDRLAPALECLNEARYELEEAARDLTHYTDSVEFNPERLQQIEERLELLRGLKRKYGDTVEEILEYGRQTAEMLDALAHSEERGQELDADLARAAGLLSDVNDRLTARRRELAAGFAQAVQAELTDLAMEKTRFDVSIEPGEPGPRGADRVEFVIAPNPGEPLKSLARIASGGEMSRVMLALKSAMARQEPLPTMVFDEIDSGVGGRTASVIGAKLSGLSQAAQVLCITHLPQIASRGGAHYYIEKRSIGDRTVTSVALLDDEARIEELARMLGGAEVTETVRRHAREMLGAGTG